MENVSASRLAGLKQLVNWQFHVWPVGGIVIKTRKRHAAIRKSIVSVKWWHSRPAYEVLAVSRDVANDATISLAALRNHSSALHLCGFPRFLPGGIILQDRGTCLLDCIFEEGLSEKVAVSSYFELCTMLWGHGLFEITFDFLRNVGVNGAGDLFFLDLGGFVADKGRAREYLDELFWRSRKDYGALGVEARSLFDEFAASHFSKAHLDKCWQLIAH